MMPGRFISLAGLMLLGAAACASGAAEPAGTGAAGAGGSIGGRPCSETAQCDNGVCIMGSCVDKLVDAGDLAAEIDPPLTSGSQLTQIVSLAGALPVLTADAELRLTVPFGVSPMSSTVLPASAGVILTVPSRIPGRPDPSFQATAVLGAGQATLIAPLTILGQQATLNIVPVSPSDQTSPPYTFSVLLPPPAPATSMEVPVMQTLLPQELPANPFTLRGHLDSPLGPGMGGFTARAFSNGVLVSTVASTTGTTINPSGDFVLLVPMTAAKSELVIQLTPDSIGSDPWVTLASVVLPDTPGPSIGLDPVALPVHPIPHGFRVAVRGDDQSPIAGATVHAFALFSIAGVIPSFRFKDDAYTDDQGAANLALIPGDSNTPRDYTLSVIPPAGSPWARRHRCCSTPR